MPSVAECQSQIEEIRKLLGWENPHQKDLFHKRNKEIATLLNDPEIVGSAAFQAFQGEYAKLASRAKNISSSDEYARRSAFEVSAELRLLKKRVRLAAAAKDPVAATSKKEVQVELLRALEREPQYRDRRERLLAIQKDLAGKPGTAKHVATLEAILNAAKGCEPDWKEALEKTQELDKLGLEVTWYEDTGLQRFVRKAVQESEDFIKKAERDIQELKDARQAVEAYEKIAGISDRGGVVENGQKLTEAIKLIENEDVEKAKNSLRKLTGELTTKITTLREIQEPLAEMVQEVTRSLEELNDFAPAGAIVGLQASHQAARALYENQQFALAKEAWDELKRSVFQTQRDYRPEYDLWQLYSKDIEAKRGILPTASKQSKLSGAANYLQSLIDHNIGTQLIPAHRFAEACKLVQDQKIIAGLDELTAQSGNSSNPQFTIPELKYQTEIAQSRQPLDVELSLIENKIKELEQRGGDTSPFAGIRATITQEWLNQTAQQEGKQRPNPKTIAVVLCDQCKAVKDKLDQALTVGLERSKADKKKAIEAAAFEKARVSAAAALRDWSEYNLPPEHQRMTDKPTLKELEESYRKLLETAKLGTYDLGKMEMIEHHCKNRLAFIGHDLDTLRKEAAQKAKNLHLEINKAQEANPAYSAFYAALRDEVDEAEGRTRSALLPQMLQGKKDLDAVKLPAPADYKDVTEKLKKATTDLNDQHLINYLPVERATLELRLKSELTKRVWQLSPAEAKDLIAAFQAEIDKNIKRAVELKDIHGNLEKRANAISAGVEAIRTQAPALYENLIKRIAIVKKSAMSAVVQSNLEMTTLEILVKKTKGNGLDKLEKAAAAAAFDKKVQKARFEGSMRVFQSSLRLAAERLYDETLLCRRNKAVYRQIDEVVNQAEHLAKAGDYSGANQELARAISLTKHYLANPVDRACASNKELPRLNQEYKAAVSKYLQQLSNLQAKLKTAEEQDGTPINTDDVRKKIIQPLFTLFSSGQFDEPVSNLLELPKTFQELEDQRTWKELALVDVRRFQTTLKTNKVLLHVTRNTISPVSVNEIGKVLADLNGALQAS